MKLIRLLGIPLLTIMFLISVTGITYGSIDLDNIHKIIVKDAPYNSFGYSLSVSGDIAVIGSYVDNDNGSDSGSAYIFVRDGNTWTLQAKLLAEDGASGDNFGESVSVSGDTVVIGAGRRGENGSNSGSAYIFVRDGETWRQQAKLLAPDGDAYDRFGCSVSVSGDTTVIGAYQDNDNGSDSGSAYIFVRDGETWTLQAKLLAEDGASDDNFGYSGVSVSGDTAVIGAHGDDDNESYSGSAYIFVRNGETWSQQAKLLAEDGAYGDCFGYSVSMSGDTALIGASGGGDNGSNTGSAYIFVRDGETWRQQAKLLAEDGAYGDHFGFSVSMSSDTALIGASGGGDNGSNTGSAYIFVRDGETWRQQAKLLAEDGAYGDHFGYSVSMSGDTALIGAMLDEGDDYNGSAYVFFSADAGNITHFITPVSGTSVGQGEWLQFNITHTNNSSNEVTYTAQPYLVLPDESVKSGTGKTFYLEPGQNRTIDSYLLTPSSAPTGLYTFGAKITYTESGEVDDDSFDFTVSSGEAALNDLSADKSSSFMLKQIERKKR